MTAEKDEIKGAHEAGVQETDKDRVGEPMRQKPFHKKGEA